MFQRTRVQAMADSLATKINPTSNPTPPITWIVIFLFIATLHGLTILDNRNGGRNDPRLEARHPNMRARKAPPRKQEPRTQVHWTTGAQELV